MRSLLLVLFTLGIVALTVTVASYIPEPVPPSDQVARRIAELASKPGLHELYVNGIVVFRNGRVIVEISGYSAEASANVVLQDGAASGLIAVYSDGRSAKLLNPPP